MLVVAVDVVLFLHHATVAQAAGTYVTQTIVIPGKVILRGTNGITNGMYRVLATTNLTTPIGLWSVIATNNFDGAGKFDCTNARAANVAQQFYRLLVSGSTITLSNSAYNLMGFGQATTGGGVLADTDTNYAKVYTATDFANAIRSKTVKVIEIMNDLNLGYNEIEASAKTNTEPFRADATPLLHPVLLAVGVSIIDVQKKSGLTIFSANGATIRHAHLNVENSSNIIIRNLRFDELWEWDESTKGKYDLNNWDFITVGNAGLVTNMWVDHCTFTKAYDGVIDIKNGSSGITLSWCKYAGDDGYTNPNSWVWQQLNSLETNKAAYTMYNFLRGNGFSMSDIFAIIQGHDKTHLIGANDLDPNNAKEFVTLHHEWFINPGDRLPRLRAGNVHDFNLYVDDTQAIVANRIRSARLAAMSTANQNTLNNTYDFNNFLNGSISTENGALLVEKSVYIDCLYPLRNNQTAPTNPVYTGKIMALDTIYHFDNANGTTTDYRGSNTNAPGDTYFGPAQAPVIPFSWNLPGNALPYTYTMDDPTNLQAIVQAGAGAGVLTWGKTNWLKTAY
jgi:pectate lyase